MSFIILEDHFERIKKEHDDRVGAFRKELENAIQNVPREVQDMLLKDYIAEIGNEHLFLCPPAWLEASEIPRTVQVWLL